MIARIRHFVSHHRIATSAAFAALFLAMADPTLHSVLLGLPLVVLAEALRTWSSGYIQKDHTLATDGPYSLTRNPMYFGNLVLGLGFALMANRWWVLVGLLLAFALIYDATIKAEEANLLRRFGDAYVRYCRDVPRFVPRLTAWRRGPFQWCLVRKHREFKTWAWLGGVLLAMSVMMWRNESGER